MVEDKLALQQNRERGMRYKGRSNEWNANQSRAGGVITRVSLSPFHWLHFKQVNSPLQGLIISLTHSNLVAVFSAIFSLREQLSTSTPTS